MIFILILRSVIISLTISIDVNLSSEIIWSEHKQDLWKWLDKIDKGFSVKKCPAKLPFKVDFASPTSSQRVYTVLRDCDPKLANARYEGIFDRSSKLPTGKGKIFYIGHTPTRNNICINLLPCINKIKGMFVNGELEGLAQVYYRDESYMRASFKKGVIQGIVSMMNKHGILQAIGYYVNGFPHGPFWFHYENIFIQTYFNQGLLDKERTVVVDSDERMVKIGVLKNQFLLKNAQNAKGKSGHSYLQS